MLFLGKALPTNHFQGGADCPGGWGSIYNPVSRIYLEHLPTPVSVAVLG